MTENNIARREALKRMGGCESFIGKSADEVKAEFDFAIANGINFIDI